MLYYNYYKYPTGRQFGDPYPRSILLIQFSFDCIYHEESHAGIGRETVLL